MTFTTLPYAGHGVAQVLMHPQATTNQLVPIRAFEASPQDVLQLVEEAQGVKYAITEVRSDEMIKEGEKIMSDETAEDTEKMDAIVSSVRVGVLAEGYPNNSVVRFGRDRVLKMGKELELGVLRIEDVVRQAVEKGRTK